MVGFVESVLEIAFALTLAACAVAAVLDLVERRRAHQRAETLARFAPQPLLAPPALVAVLAGAGAEEAADAPPLAGRRDEFLALGLDELDALAAAAEVDVDDFRSLLRRGCPPRLALEILR